jgi:hypothetical protein
VKRGLYKTFVGWLINADCNGTAHIIRQGAIQLGITLAEVGRGSLTLAQRIDLFTRLSKSYPRLPTARFYPAKQHPSRIPRILFGGDVKTVLKNFSN